MSYVERIKRATSAREAALILAEGLDELAAKVAEHAEGDPWEQWETAPLVPVKERVAVLRVDEPAEREATLADDRVQVFDPFLGEARVVTEDELAELRQLAREQMSAATKGGDEDEIRSAQAAYRLLNETGEPPPEVDRGRTLNVKIDHNDVSIEIPVVDAERKDARREWARTCKIWEIVEPKLNEDDAVAAYANGGPQWLYAYDRDNVLTMPFAWRQQMIHELDKDSTAEAQEMARDLLKADAEDSKPTQIGSEW